MIAWIPFFAPLNMFQTWWILLAIPLAFFISMVYKAMRYREYDKYWRYVVVMTLQIVLGMVAMSVGLMVLVEFVVPRL